MHKRGGRSFAVNSESKFSRMKWQNGQGISRDTFLEKKNLETPSREEKAFSRAILFFFMQADSEILNRVFK